MPLAPTASLPPEGLLAFLAIAAGCSALACLIWALRFARDRRWVARRIEARHPELGTGLLAALEVADGPKSPAGRLGFLQTKVIQAALDHRRRHDWDDVVPSWRLRGMHVAHAATLVLLCVACFGLSGQARSHFSRSASRTLPSSARDVRVEPGDAELERGTSLLVVARFGGSVPAEASLIVEDAAHDSRTHSMTRSLEDPTFAGRVEAVNADLAYRVAYGGATTPTYHVRVFEYPELERSDARLAFPPYTALPPKTAQDIRHITAVEGTELTLLCRLNKDVAAAKLVDQEQRETALEIDQRGPHVYRASWKLANSGRYRVSLLDREGRSNQRSAEIVVNVTRNHLPVIRLAHPASDVRVSPLEELTLSADLEDDFGLVRHGVSYAMPGRKAQEIVLQGSSAANRHLRAAHLIDLESLHAMPDQLVSYFFWAEDIGPDEKPRRTAGDMYFAEVRHFDEIFRQGEQPPGGSPAREDDGGGNAEESGRLAELQKEIIGGTWKLMRRETDAKPSSKFTADSRLLEESQHKAIEQAERLSERLQDATSKANLDQASRFMKDAELRLKEAAEQSSIAALAPALAAEQAAYQALLKLRAREFQVIRNNARQQGRGGGGVSGPSQRQLAQLELSSDVNRYEQQSSARSQNPQRDQAERELRGILNRLRELAQRQNDLNERIKELQSALEEARTPQTRAEIERQLKRLREQEQEILRDADDLRARMERDENRDRMADARQQIEQSREHVRQASQALEEGRLPQAVTAGARAGRQLDNLREQLRKQSSHRFSEEMTEMREQARRLEKDQTQLSEALEAWNREPHRSLRDNGERQRAQSGLKEQEKRLEQLLERARDTVTEAEETEPVLAKGLYDTVRKATEQKIPDALKVAQQLVELGVAGDAARSSRRAGAGIQQLREGVERAARSVLGDEAGALRLAQAEVEDLAGQINREIDAASGRERERPGRESAGQERNSARPSDQPAVNSPRSEQPPSGGRPQGGLRQAQQGGAQGGGSTGGVGGLARVLEGLGRGPGGPITGEGFRQWFDRMRDLEDLLEDPEWRAEAARIRDRARGARDEFKRHAREPDWSKLKVLVAEPMNELGKRIADEIRRRESPDALVPIDRDPVPPQFAESVRRYFERLGSGR
jgi:hypothetical protein